MTRDCSGALEYYAILGVDRDADTSMLKDARKAKLLAARRGEDGPTEWQLNEAFAVLSNASERRRYDLYGHADLSLILPKLYLGGQSAAHQPDVLKGLDITHVLTVAHSLTYLDVGLQDANIVHKTFEVEDSDAQDLKPYLEEGMQFISEGRAAGGILVHCQYGVSRSATFVMRYLMLMENLCADDALAAVKEKRPKACPGPRFWKMLQELSGQS
eukprot:gnl/MRDRNA2_/MRDRNA2_133004_c0_seq1.p1 gnl/MRDRNA2_/MRDRNA2_133004_c0~~gnl/MRDRNA2_/MRDRNA2_133004_c0_seq1.p1  ORF type:complete len:215 (+),score=31.70 gnl/MRDRNA2_/MRDRNA2_133004_c0_seq1:81-725(+)